MDKIVSIEPAIDPSNRPILLLDWELTLRCNLDCSYCGPQWHDNHSPHPPLSECINTIDFMFEYVNRYMMLKPKWQRIVVLNIYGGEAIYHPDIAEILQEVRKRHEPFKDDWTLTVTVTTNGVAGKNLWSEVTKYVDEFTISFHSEALPKQRQQVLDNILYNKAIGRKQKVVFVMHNDPQMWDISMQAVEFCKEHNIKHVVKANDTPTPKWQYNKEQFKFFADYYESKTPEKSRNKIIMLKQVTDDTVGMGKIGRSCCGGRGLCTNQDLKHPVGFVPHSDFKDWYCSVNWFFLYIRQHNGDVYVNKDCQMNFEGGIGPIGNLSNTKKILDDQQKLIDGNTVPVIQCKQVRCICGYCAPKAEKFEDFTNIMQKHVDSKIKFAYNTSLNDK